MREDMWSIATDNIKPDVRNTFKKMETTNRKETKYFLVVLKYSMIKLKLKKFKKF